MTVLVPSNSSVATLHVLIVDRQATTRAIYNEVVRTRGYEVTTTTSRAAALDAAERLDGLLDVLIVDLGLPDTEPTALAREIVGRIGPRPTLYVSTWAEEFLDLSDAPGRWCVLRLPVEAARFTEAIEWLAGRGSRPASSHQP